MWRFIFSLIALLVFGTLSAQSPLPKTAIPKEPRDFRPSKLKLSYDLIDVGERVFKSFDQGHQFQATIDFDQYFLAAEYGMVKVNRTGPFNYNMEGSFFSIGPEVNLLKNERKSGNSMTFGMRYATANFQDNLSFVSSGPFGDQQIYQENPSVKVVWAELTTGLNVNVWKGLYIGYTVRMKFWKKLTGVGELIPHDIPGFGLYERNNGVGFNYYVGWAIPLREKYPETIPD